MPKTPTFLAALFCMLFELPFDAVAQTLPTLMLRHNIEGIQFTTPVTFALTPQNPERIAYSSFIDLKELSGVLNKLADEASRGDIEHKGTSVWAEAGLLAVKVHLKIKLGGFFGSTNGSVSARFQSDVVDNRASLSTRSINLRISNDLVRLGADLAGIREQVVQDILDVLQKALTSNDAALAVPPNLQAMGVTLDNARFETIDGTLFLVMSGHIPAEIELLR